MSLRRGAAVFALSIGSLAGGCRPAAPASPMVAVILGTYNRKQHLERALASVRSAVGSLPYEIVVVDGGSTDGSREWLAGEADVVLIGASEVFCMYS